MEGAEDKFAAKSEIVLSKLVIVESPSKIKTLKKYLGPEYDIQASVGHIRDLPDKELGIDTEHGFKPTYQVSADKRKVITELKKCLKKADELLLATDPDREGEAISWHLLEVLNPKIPHKRLVFHELTAGAIREALNELRELDRNLVAAQETRRIMDRLFGFPVSEVLWYNVKGGLSAGRVQSPAIKLVVDREKLRSRFVQSEYWSIKGQYKTNGDVFAANLIALDDQKIAGGKDFNRETGKLSKSNRIVLSGEKARDLSERLKTEDWHVRDIEQKPVTSNPHPPFITSTLQQEGVRKLRMSSRQVMQTAQRLYENGYITYIRTDSVHLSGEAVQAARQQVEELYGKEYIPAKPRTYKSKVKNAQEAHEAIRPAGTRFRTPEDLKGDLKGKDWDLYHLIWTRTLASQMKSAKLLQTIVSIQADNALFQATGRIIQFPGYFKVYVKGRDSESELDDREALLPSLTLGQSLECEKLEPVLHVTKPTPRYTEASLIKDLEARGIGRPSTYASIMETIQRRGYVNRSAGKLIPTFTAYAVVQFLENHFKDLVDLEFTANLEESLDAISRSELKESTFLDTFYYGEDDHPGLKILTEQKFDKQKSRLIQTIEDREGVTAALKIGRYGLYLERDGDRAAVPLEFVPSELTPEAVTEFFEKKNAEPDQLGEFPETGEPIYLKKGRYGPYLQTGEKMKSLLPGLKPEDVTLDTAVNILSLPREIGSHPETGEKIQIDIGRYGPYMKCGKVNRKIQKPDDLLTLTVERALELLAQKTRNQTTSLKQLGKDSSGSAIELKSGRYGPYVTNGKINVTIPKALDPEEITLETAVSMIAEKAAKGPAKRRNYRRKK